MAMAAQWATTLIRHREQVEKEGFERQAHNHMYQSAFFGLESLFMLVLFYSWI